MAEILGWNAWGITCGYLGSPTICCTAKATQLPSILIVPDDRLSPLSTQGRRCSGRHCHRIGPLVPRLNEPTDFKGPILEILCTRRLRVSRKANSKNTREGETSHPVHCNPPIRDH